MAKFKLRDKAILAAAREAFRDTVLAYARVCTEVITDSNPQEFPDFNGQDIVDTGQLRSSQKVEIGDTSARVSYGANYALYVHEGYTTRSGHKQPARPWLRAAASRLNIPKTFSLELARRLA